MTTETDIDGGGLAATLGASASTANYQRETAMIAARLERLPLTSYQRGIFYIIATAWFFDSMDLGTLTFVLGSIKTEFGLDAKAAGFLGAMSFFGMFMGAALSGMLADRFGRTIVFQTSMIFWGLGSLFCGLSQTADSLALARILLGFGMGMEFPVAQSIVSEIMPAAKRGRYLALMEGFWPIGFIFAGLLTFAVLADYGWRTVFFVEAAPALLLLVIRRYVPESPRWLASRGHVDQAKALVDRLEAKVKERSGLTSLPEPEPVPMTLPPESDRFSFLQLWTGIYAKRTIMVWALWFFALIGYYGLTTWLGALLQRAGFPVTKSIYYTILISLAGVPGFFTSAWLVEAWGRKPTCVLMLLGSAVASYFYGTSTSQETLIGFGLCMQFFMFGMWSVLYAYTPELYPTRARATGTGCASAVGRLGSLIGPYVVGIVLPSVGQIGVFALGAGAFTVAALVVFALGEETRGRTLEAIST